MNASRELDALVAEKVMGWKLKSEPHTRWILPDGGELIAPPPAYSTDISAAWQVVEEIGLFDSPSEQRARGGEGDTWYVLGRKGDKWVVASPCVAHGMYYDLGSIEPLVAADTAPLAICRAALAVMGGEGK